MSSTSCNGLLVEFRWAILSVTSNPCTTWFKLTLDPLQFQLQLYLHQTDEGVTIVTVKNRLSNCFLFNSPH